MANISFVQQITQMQAAEIGDFARMPSCLKKDGVKKLLTNNNLCGTLKMQLS